MSLQQTKVETDTTRHAEHSPLPWKVYQANEGTLDVCYSDGEIRSVIARLHIEHLADEHSNGGIQANAAYIVKACNEYPKLLQALKEIEAWAESRDGSPESDEKALSEISEIATQAQLNANG